MIEDDKQFDLKIRSILNEGREDVPGHIWDAIDRRLTQAGEVSVKKHIIPVWMRRTLAGIAASAAAAFLLIGIYNGRQETDKAGKQFAVVQGNEQMYTDGVPTEGKPGSAMIADASLQSSKALPVNSVIPTEAISKDVISRESAISSDTEPGVGTSGQDNPAETNGKATVNKSGNADARKTDAGEKWPDAFPEDIRSKDRIKTAITISGNAISNSQNFGNGTTTASLGPQKRPGAISHNTVSESSASSYGIPLSFGVGAKIMFTPKWSLGVGINYSLLTRTFAGDYYQVDDAGNVTQTSFSDIYNSQSYIGIPVNVYYSIVRADFVDLYAYAGGTVEKCIYDKYLMNAEAKQITHKENSKGVQLSANAGIGVEFIVTKELGIYLDPSIRYYFKSSQPKSIRTVQPLNFGIEMGLRIRL